MIRISILVVACLVALLQQQGVQSLLSPTTQDTPKSSALEDPQAPKTPEEQRISGDVSDIMEIRSQLGGVSETLGDLSLEMPGKPKNGDGKPVLSYDEEFQKQLTQQARNRPPEEDTKSSLEAEFAMQEPSERQEAIREAARMLEEAAAILEEVSSYDHADDVRQRASQLWKSARQR